MKGDHGEPHVPRLGLSVYFKEDPNDDEARSRRGDRITEEVASAASPPMPGHQHVEGILITDSRKTERGEGCLHL